MNFSSNREHGRSSRAKWHRGRKTGAPWPSDYVTDQLAFYGAYHTHPINQLIHIVFVPVILFSMMVFFHLYLPTINILTKHGDGGVYKMALSSFLEGGGENVANDTITVSASFVLYLAYTILFVTVDPTWVGASATVYLYALYHYVQPFCEYCDGAGISSWKAALMLHVLGWYMQIHPGHAIFEKRKPALMDSLVQAFAFAPLFIWYEVLFRLGVRHDYQLYLEEVIRQKREPWMLQKNQEERK